MRYLYVVYTVSLLGLLVAGVLEQRRHYRNLRSIPLRVLVNGTRGKSSITRLTAGALRGGGVRTVAKTTGTAARFIFPDGTEEPVYRKFGIANIIEQVGIVRRAAAEAPGALVIECMAVMPQLQEVNQDKLIRSNIGVLCNVREDHLEEMGPTLQDAARNLSRSMPRGGLCVTAETELLPVLREEAARRRCRLLTVDPESVTDEDMEPFTWFTFKDNVAIALAVAQEAGISREDALRGMYAAPPDPGVLTVDAYHVEGKTLRLANVFAANDPRSTLLNVQQLRERGAIPAPLYTLINCRPDRIERNAQMGQLVPELGTEKVFVIGAPSRSAVEAVPRHWSGKIVDLGGLQRQADDIFRNILREIDREASVVAIGNIHGQGEMLLEHLEHLGALR